MALASGKKLHSPDSHVFINCPFDSAYRRLFDAIIFAVACCGFIPRSALERGGKIPEPRINKIMRAIRESRYSIHDHDALKMVIGKVVNLLAFNSGATGKITPQRVSQGFPRFLSRKESLATKWHREPPWEDVVKCALEVAELV